MVVIYLSWFVVTVVRHDHKILYNDISKSVFFILKLIKYNNKKLFVIGREYTYYMEAHELYVNFNFYYFTIV